MLNILVTGAGGGVGQGIIKSLKMIKDMQMNIIAADMTLFQQVTSLQTKQYYSQAPYRMNILQS